MPDQDLEQMLAVANALTAEDLDRLRGERNGEARRSAQRTRGSIEAEAPSQNVAAPASRAPALLAEPAAPPPPAAPPATSGSAASRGAYERQRPRESKVSTGCLGNERPTHEWWPVGTKLAGRMGEGIFTAQVVENPRGKSGRSILITSGPADGAVCLTPTRAALEATQAYRKANNLGRAGGVTNGWTFWQPVP